MSRRVGFKKSGEPVTRTREWREFRGWTQTQLAERADCSIATISRLERGDSSVTLQVVAVVAEALGIDAITLQTRGPEEDDEMMHLWASADEKSREKILSIAKTLIKD